jgi:aspartyl-tRNA(Asn)/glutamyl-tRNA(Gln) amidotransferase subunit A
MLGPVHNGYARRELLLAGLSSVFRLSAEITDVANLSLLEASQRVRRKLISPVELTTVCLERIQRLNPKLNAFITITAERALSQAKKPEKEGLEGRWRGPLHGIPIALKDIIDTAGVRTTAGSAVFIDRVPNEDAEVVRRVLNAGAIILGKLNTAEFAFSDTSVISHFGPVHNPWNLN